MTHTLTSNDRVTISTLQVGADAVLNLGRSWAYGHVTNLRAGKVTITLADGSVWVFPAEEVLVRYA